MSAGRYDFSIEQGATFRRTITWKDANGNPVNLTGSTARLQIRETIGTPAAFVTVTTENGGITLGDTLGTIAIFIPAASTTLIVAKAGVYDLEVVSSAGEVVRLLEGKVKIRPEVTR